MAQESIDKSLLQTFVPVNALSGDQLDWLLDHQDVCRYASGDALFSLGEEDNRTIYLLSGSVVLTDEQGHSREVSAGDIESWHPLDHAQPRRSTAVAQGDVSVVRFDSFRLDNILSWDQSAGYVLTDINANSAYQDDREWMTRLLRSKLFHRVPPANILEIFRRLKSQRHKEGDVIIRQGEAADCCYILKEGVCEVAISMGDDKPTPVAMLEEGQWFGEEALLSGKPRNATITMATDGVLMRLGRDDFDALLREPVIRSVSAEDALQAIRDGGRWLDVRTSDEYDQERLVGSTNMSLNVLRLKSRLLDPSKTYVAYCDTGRRSATAAFLLKNAGLNVIVLDGGLNSSAAALAESLSRGD